MKHSRHKQDGVALLEAVIAIAILSGGALTTIALLHEAGTIENRLRMDESAAVDMDRVLAAMALLSRHDLDRRLGWRDVRGYAVYVSRPSGAIYRIAVTQPSNPEAGLATLVYRP